MALNRLVSGVTPRRAASSPRHRIATRPRLALGSDIDNGSTFIICPRERVASRTWTGSRLGDSGSLRCPGARLRPVFESRLRYGHNNLKMSAIGQSGHDLLRCTYLLLTQSGHWLSHARPLL